MRISDIVGQPSLNEAGSWQDIYAANKSTIANPNKIQIGQKITLPGGGTYTVQKGDTLSKIAGQQSGGAAMRSAPSAAPTTTPTAPAASPSGLPRGQQAAQGTLQTADDFVRSMANAATFGYADKLAAKMSSMFGGDEYNQSLKKEYGKSAEAAGRSPIASTAGEIAGTVASPAFAGGAALGAKALTKVAPNVGKLGQFAAGTAGGIAADTAAEKVAKAVDPKNPWIDENKVDNMKSKEFITKEGKISAAARAAELAGSGIGRFAKAGTPVGGALSTEFPSVMRKGGQTWERVPGVSEPMYKSGSQVSHYDDIGKAATKDPAVWRKGAAPKTEPVPKATTTVEPTAPKAGGKPLSRTATALAAAAGGGLIGYGLGSDDRGQGPLPAPIVPEPTPTIDPKPRPPKPNKPAKDDPWDLQSVKPSTRPGPGSEQWLRSELGKTNKPENPATTADAVRPTSNGVQDYASLGADADRKDRLAQAASTLAEELNEILRLAGRK